MRSGVDDASVSMPMSRHLGRRVPSRDGWLASSLRLKASHGAKHTKEPLISTDIKCDVNVHQHSAVMALHAQVVLKRCHYFK